MKKFIVALITVLLLGSCSKSDDPTPLDPNATISLRPAKGVTLKSSTHMSAYDIVKYASVIGSENPKVTNIRLERGFASTQRDFSNIRLLMWGTDIIDTHGDLVPEFIEAHDFIIEAWYFGDVPYADYKPGIDQGKLRKDTVAYIPNSTIRAAEVAIKQAYSSKDYTKCYALMDSAFKFIPITGAEYRALKAQGKN